MLDYLYIIALSYWDPSRQQVFLFHSDVRPSRDIVAVGGEWSFAILLIAAIPMVVVQLFLSASLAVVLTTAVLRVCRSLRYGTFGALLSSVSEFECAVFVLAAAAQSFMWTGGPFSGLVVDGLGTGSFIGVIGFGDGLLPLLKSRTASKSLVRPSPRCNTVFLGMILGTALTLVLLGFLLGSRIFPRTIY